jgi:hypothetical protein
MGEVLNKEPLLSIVGINGNWFSRYESSPENLLTAYTKLLIKVKPKKPILKNIAIFRNRFLFNDFT